MDIWIFIRDQIVPSIGWGSIAAIEFLIIFLSIPVMRFYLIREVNSYKRELAVKDATIQNLSMQLEDSRQYRVDTLVQSLAERVKIENQENERLRSDVKLSRDESEKKEQQRQELRQEIIALKKKLKSYEKELDDLLDNYCDVCDPDEEDSHINFVWWGTSECNVIDPENLIGKIGHCNYCQSPQIKCSVCSCLTSIDLEGAEKVECNGGCGVVSTVSSYIEDKSQQYEIKASLESG